MTSQVNEWFKKATLSFSRLRRDLPVAESHQEVINRRESMSKEEKYEMWISLRIRDKDITAEIALSSCGGVNFFTVHHVSGMPLTSTILWEQLVRRLK